MNEIEKQWMNELKWINETEKEWMNDKRWINENEWTIQWKTDRKADI